MLAKETKVYRDTLLFVDELMRITINFKREYRRTLAERLENKSLELVDYIVLANSNMEHRLYYLQQFTVCFEQVNALLDLAVREPLLEAVFSDRTFNCRKEKGVLYGVAMLKEDIRQCSHDYTQDCYIMRLDMKGFFMSIEKSLLDRMLQEFISERYDGHDKEEILWLTHVTVMHRPELDCERRSGMERWKRLPPNKSLFTNGDGQGLPIGNLSSQLFANFLLNRLDWYLEKDQGFQYHGRYVDDFYVIHESKQRLLDAVPGIRKMLREQCHAELHPDKFYIQHYSKGIKFTGSVVKFGRVYPAKRTVGNFMTSIYKLNKAKDVDEIRDCIQSVNSYLGILRHTDSYAIRRRVLGMIDKRLWQYIYIKGHFEILCLKERHKKVEIPWRDKGLQVYYMKDPINWKLLEEDDPVI